MQLKSLLVYSVFTNWGSALPHELGHLKREGSTAASSLTYAPSIGKCPAKERWIRPAVGISSEEALWVQSRKRNVLKPLGEYLGRLKLDDLDLDEYMGRISQNESLVPNIAIAISGGAWASAMTGVGVLQALDDRFEPSARERTGGILQCATYTAGLSGGTWPVLSLASFDFPTIADMVSAWHVETSPLDPRKGSPYAANDTTLLEQVYEKFKAGFDVAYADFLGRAVSYEFLAGQEGGLGSTISGITELSNYKSHGMPFPIWQAAELGVPAYEHFNIKFPGYNSTLYEWSPLEFGAWKGPSGFFPMEYLGTKMVDGSPSSQDSCVTGFDSQSYMAGVPGDAWNAWWLSALSNGKYGAFSKRHVNAKDNKLERRGNGQPVFPIGTLEALKVGFEKAFNLSRAQAIYATIPNPFATKASVSNNSNPPQNLTLVDGSEAGQVLPLWPLIQPARKSDFIIAWDNDEEAAPYYWSNGENLRQTYVYATARNIPFPVVPPNATFINRNYTSKPTFFGCNANLTNTKDLQAPIILYMANAPYSSYVNFTGFQTNFTHEEMAVILTNSFNIVTQGNGTLDSGWAECIGCAAIDRSLARVGMPRSAQCQQCFSQHCWDGVEDNKDPGIVNPTLILDPSFTFVEWNKLTPQTGRFWGEVSK